MFIPMWILMLIVSLAWLAAMQSRGSANDCAHEDNNDDLDRVLAEHGLSFNRKSPEDEYDEWGIG